jgi:hypothetical protein
MSLLFNEPATIVLDGARLPPKYVFKNNMSLTNSKIGPTQTIKLQLLKVLKDRPTKLAFFQDKKKIF